MEITGGNGGGRGGGDPRDGEELPEGLDSAADAGSIMGYFNSGQHTLWQPQRSGESGESGEALKRRTHGQSTEIKTILSNPAPERC